ncbi:Exportin-6-B, partial [Frankliniella fusca]
TEARKRSSQADGSGEEVGGGGGGGGGAGCGRGERGGRGECIPVRAAEKVRKGGGWGGISACRLVETNCNNCIPVDSSQYLSRLGEQDLAGAAEVREVPSPCHPAPREL